MTLLNTKFYRPPVRPESIERPHLIVRLDKGLDCKLTLVSAPAGYGKTTLISAWARQCGRPVAWLTLDGNDNDPARFLSYLISAVQGIKKDVGRDILGQLQSLQRPDIKECLLPLINQLDSVSENFILVLDDYQAITSMQIHNALTFIIDHQPPHMHLVITTRIDPPLPIARLRGNGQLSELRQADLRFNVDEISIFLRRWVAKELSHEDMNLLAERTEGWVAGLQIAAIAMRNKEDLSRFISTFGGSHEYIMDYFVSEVLNAQSDHVKSFLLQTSILDQLCGPLCDAVTGRHGGQKMLEDLTDANLFVVALDDECRWYRYHRLFADLLKKRLEQEDDAAVHALHIRASRWFSQNSLPQWSVEHAFQAGDFSGAALVLEESSEFILNRGDYGWLLQWMEKLPEEQQRSHLKLYVLKALILANTGHLREAEQCLQHYEESGPGIVIDPKLQDWLTGRVATVRALIAIFRGYTSGSREYARLALEKIPRDSDSPWRAHLLIALCHMYLAEGDLEAARQNLAEVIVVGEQAQNAYMILDAATHLVLTLWMQGRLREAGEVSQKGLHYIERYGLERTLEAGLLFTGLGFILCEQHELFEAEKYIRKGLEATRQADVPAATAWVYQIFIRYLIATGDLKAAEESVRIVDRLTRNLEIPLWIQCGNAGLRSQVWVRLGKNAEAEDFLEKRGITGDAGISYPHEGEFFSFALLMRSSGRLEPAAQLLEKLIDWAKTAGQQYWVIAALVQLSLVHHAEGRKQEAIQALAKAMEIAGPDGYIQIFLDEGQSLAGLVSEAYRQEIQPDFAGRLLALFPSQQPAGAASVLGSSPDILGAISPRETEVLRLLADGFSNKEIADKLFISLRTVKYHNNSIFTKLNVNSRTRAVSMARSLGIL